jgi:pyruvate kinase
MLVDVFLQMAASTGTIRRMRYELIATLGPTSQDETTWQGMVTCGVSALRLNTSHLSLEQVVAWLERLEIFFEKPAIRLPIVLDLQGSKWRLGQFSPFELRPDQVVELVYADAAHRPDILPVPHRDFFQAAPLSSGEIALNDAKILLALESASEETMRARVRRGGMIAPNKGITFTASAYRREALSEKDQVILNQTQSGENIRYAISYLRDGLEMAHYREVFGPQPYLIAKLERRPALEDALEIARHCEQMWLCRGDLGAELGLAAMAAAVHDFSQRIDEFSIPVVMAGQVLEHMTTQPTPTRSEVCYLYDALRSGYAGFVLSDETAVGKYPLESCRAAALFRA